LHPAHRTWEHGRVPTYVHATFVLVVASFILAAVFPAPRMTAARAGLFCFWLMMAGMAIFAVAVSMIALAMVTTLPAYLVFSPALAVLGVALALWLAMLWVANAPAPPAEQADGEDGEDGGGGGGGLGPEDDPPRDPGPQEGIRWDAFDREREAWENAREPVRESELTGV
jgi:hypothetical protein